MDIASSENSNWLYDYGLMEDIGVPGGEFPVAATGFIWPQQPLNASPNARCAYLFFVVWIPRKFNDRK